MSRKERRRERQLHRYVPGYSEMRMQQYEQGMADQRAQANEEERQQYLRTLFGHAGQDAVTDLEGNEVLAAVPGSGYLGSEQDMAAKLQFAKGLLAAPEHMSRSHQLGSSLLQQYMKPQAGPDLPTSVREYQFAQSQGFQGGFQDWLEAKRQPQTVVNVGNQGENLDPMISDPNTLLKFTDAEGNHPPGPMPQSQLYQNFSLASADSAKGRRSNAVQQEAMERLTRELVGPDGLLQSQAGKGLTGVTKNFLQGGWQQLSQDDPRYIKYEAMLDSVVPLMRPPGSGPMSDEDFARIKRPSPA